MFFEQLTNSIFAQKEMFLLSIFQVLFNINQLGRNFLAWIAKYDYGS